jgi:hypothetical protein
MTCGSNALNQLFGISAYANIAPDANGLYNYPTAGSIVGAMIAGSAISNRLDTSDCVKRYSSCLKRDDVCGSDFELCTSNREFKKQKIFCESTLARCMDAGKIELFGRTDTSLDPMGSGCAENNRTGCSRVKIMIDEGAELADVNSVKSCYKVADNCILKTCSRNPYACIEATKRQQLCAADQIEQATEDSPAICQENHDEILGEPVNKTDIAKLLKINCRETVGANRACFMTANDGKIPKSADLKDEYKIEETYADIMNGSGTIRGRWGNDSMKAQIDQLRTKFNAKTKTRCQETIVNCAMRNCGMGSGLACYNIAAAGTNASNATVDIMKAKDSIKSGCEVIINNDAACIYEAAKFDDEMGVLDFSATSVFDKVFTSPSATDGPADPTTAVAMLNLKLAQSFSPTAMADMTKSCQNAAKACVREKCGSDFVNCYRARNDVYSSISDSGSASFDKSMNKAGGVLDRTIVVGLCMDTIKTNSTCEELLKAEVYSKTNTAVSNGGAAWGNATSVHDGWLGVGKTTVNSQVLAVTTLDGICQADGGAVDNELPPTANCGTTVAYNDDNDLDDNNKPKSKTAAYNTPATIATEYAYSVSLAANQIFQDVVNTFEAEAQAIYKSKLTQQQALCYAANNDNGIMGKNDLGSTYAWARLKSKKVPAEYGVKGLQDSQFVASNEIYGSFCRVRVDLRADNEKTIKKMLEDNAGWSKAFFAAGDSFTCGSWIPSDELEKMSEEVANAKTRTNKDGDLTGGQKWTVAGVSLLTGVGGLLGMNALQEKTGLGGLLGTKDKTGRDALNGDQRAALADAKTCVDTYKKTTLNKTPPAPVKDTPMVNAVAAANGVSKIGAITVSDNESADSLAGRCQMVINQLNNAVDKGNSTTKLITNIVGSGIGATIGGVTTAQIMKASNRSEWSAAQQEWYNNVGQHIKCYVGTEDIGSYGDILGITVE